VKGECSYLVDLVKDVLEMTEHIVTIVGGVIAIIALKRNRPGN